MNIKPIRDNVLIQLSEVQEKSSGGIILQRKTREQTGVVLEVGTDVEHIKVGMKIAFQHGDFKPVGDDQAIVKEAHIVGYFYE